MLELPKGVMVPTAADFTAMQTWAPLMGQSVDELLPYRWNSQVEMDATVPTEPGQYGFRLDEDMRMYRWDSVNSDWVPAALTPADQNFFRFETKAEMDLWVGQPGQRAVVWGDLTPANNAEYVWESGGWVLPETYPFAEYYGLTSVPSKGVIHTIALPSGLFTEIPLVFIQVSSSSGANIGTTALVTGRTTTSFNVRFDGGSSAAVGFAYHAIQATPNDATG